MNTSAQTSQTQFELRPVDSQRLALLCGALDEHLKQIEKRLQVVIQRRDHCFTVIGSDCRAAQQVLETLYWMTADGQPVSASEIHLQLSEALNREPQIEGKPTQPSGSVVLPGMPLQLANSTPQRESMTTPPQSAAPAAEGFSIIRTKKGNVRPRSVNQQRYVRAVQTHDINFGVGPAGTGKTYLAVACAVEALLRDEVERILLVRPAVEAGERLGFLPGDLAQKVDPYLRPLYDALYEMLGFETVAKLQERNIIEIAPLAYMRGRTLNGAYVILDEAQNTTREQMKMFLTRIGFGSTAVITGDASQIDLPRGVKSGLVHAIDVLSAVETISFTHFRSGDVVRHPIVQSIVDAYESWESRHGEESR
ncbi:MAG: PhoH family protein [Porticoccaceae bacterium]